jgi:hypothetical protein
MGKSLLGAIAAIVAVTVLVAGYTSLPNTPQTQTAGTGGSTPDATNVTVKPAERSNTTLTITSSSPTDVYLGDHVVTTGRLVDAKGKGIPNQTIIFKSVAQMLGFTYDYPVESVKTNSTGAFEKVGTISAHDAPSFIKEVVVEGWIEYAGNDLYKPATTPRGHVTVHLT